MRGMGQLNHEPSMEDILASIKRIIAEDSEAAAVRSPRIRREVVAMPAPSVAATELSQSSREDVVDTSKTFATEAAEADAEPEAEAESADVLELTSPLAEDVPQPRASAPTQEAVISLDRLTSDPAAQASRNAFAALSQMQVRAETGAENSLEGLVSDLLRPMLREWLDRELPSMVERMVQAEITRLSGRS